MELSKAQQVQEEVRTRIKTLENRLIVGGQNLLEKAETQARLLEQSANELRAQEMRAQSLRQKLKEKKEERFSIEEKYNSLQVKTINYLFCSSKSNRPKTLW